MIDAKSTFSKSEGLLSEFLALRGSLSYENRGIFFSELLFLWAASSLATQPCQIIESGRARGLSTKMLARLFPKSRIVSLEYEADHPDARFAEESLAGHPNVALLYGDANVILPELLLPGDIVLIDGPKGMAAVALALKALATGKPASVFIHDCFRGQAMRQFLEKNLPASFFSDDADFVARFRFLDEDIWSQKRHTRQDGNYGDDDECLSYGPTMACIPITADTDYAKYAAMATGLMQPKLSKRLWRRFFGKRN